MQSMWTLWSCLEHNQVCRFLAQTMNCLDYIKQEPEKAERNKGQYNHFNNIKTVKMLSLLPNVEAKIAKAHTRLELEKSYNDEEDVYQLLTSTNDKSDKE